MADQTGMDAALAALQGALPRITKDATAQIGSRDYRYANLAAIHDTILPLLSERGFAWITKPTLTEATGFALIYELRYAPTGETVSGTYPLPSSGSPQQIGSAITYARRYTLTAVLGIAPAEDDDDGAGAEKAHKLNDAERAQAGLMTRAQQREHAALRKHDQTRPADRSTGRLPDDDWTTAPPPDGPR